MSDIPASIDINPPGENPTASVIWMHGLGADGHDFVPVVERFGARLQAEVRFVFPRAPIRSITINGGLQMRAWYDIAEINLAAKEDAKGIKASQQLIQLLIEREQGLGIPTHRIALIGFSQGGAMALYAGLRFNEPLAGIVCLSGYLPLPEMLQAERNLANQKTPIFIAHGMFDTVVPLMLGQMAREQIEGLDNPVEWHSYPMAHSVIPQEIEDVERFFIRVFTLGEVTHL